MPAPYTIIIGLEVHVQLLTQSKMFCGCSTKFGEPPNTQTCPVCIGMPGSLPVINRKAFELALKTAVALNCEIARFTKWDRKNYYYPDLPKGYQISQFDLPIGAGGWLEIEGENVSPLSSGEGPGVRATGSGQWSVASGQWPVVSDQRTESSNQQSTINNQQSPNPSSASPCPIPEGEGTTAAKRIRIRRHLEEDAGKSMHDEGGGRGAGGSGQWSVAGGQNKATSDFHPSSLIPHPSSPVPRPSPLTDSRIDLNRAGTPLLEIVSQPDLRSPAEAKAYLTELKLLLGYLGVSDCNMQEGSLRVDANVNLHIDTPQGKIATPIVEVKNMNSFRAVERVLAYEAQRQWQEWQETGHKLGDVHKTTRGWDEALQTTRPQRSKEESSDYRYFPDPDLVSVTVSNAEVERVQAELGELPAVPARLEQTYGITPYDSDVLVSQGRPLVDYFIELAEACGDGKAASNWVQQDVLRWLGEQHVGIDKYPVAAKSLAELIGKVRGGVFDTSRGREALGLMVSSDKSLAEATDALGIEEIDDAAVLELCRQLIRANPKIVAEVKEGKLKGLGALIGQAKKQNPNVNPNSVRDLCLELIQRGEG